MAGVVKTFRFKTEAQNIFENKLNNKYKLEEIVK